MKPPHKKKKRSSTTNYFLAGLLVIIGVLVAVSIVKPHLTKVDLRDKIEADPSRAGVHILALGGDGVEIVLRKLKSKDHFERDQGLDMLENLLMDRGLYEETPFPIRGRETVFRDYLLTPPGRELARVTRECIVFNAPGVRTRAAALLYVLASRGRAAALVDAAELLRLSVIVDGASGVRRRTLEKMNLSDALRSDDPVTAYEAAACVCETGAPAHIEELKKTAVSECVPLRLISVRAIGLFGSPAEEELILSLVDDPSKMVGAEAVHALGRMGGAASAETLVAKLGKFPTRSFRAAVESLVLLTGAPVDPPDALDLEKSVTVQVELLKHWDSVKDGFNIRSGRLAALRHKSSAVVKAALAAIGQSGDMTCSGNLVAFLDSKDAGVRAAAARALGVMRFDAVVEKLARLVLDTDRSVRLAANGALVAITGVDYDFAFLDRLEPADARLAAADAWKRWCERMKLRSKEERLVAAAAWGGADALRLLKDSGTGKSVEFLLAFLHVTASDLRVERGFLRELLYMQEEAGAAGRLAANMLVRLAAARDDFSIGTISLANEKLEYREASASAAREARSLAWRWFIGLETGGSAAWKKAKIEKLSFLMSEKQTADLLMAAGVLGELEQLKAELALEDAKLRVLAAKALGELAGADAAACIMELLKSEESSDVVRALAEALIKVGSDSAVKDLARLAVTGPESLVPSIILPLRKAESSAVVDAIIPLAGYSDYHVRDRAAEVLGIIRSWDGVPVLADLLFDPEVPVRWTAIKALLFITGEDFGFNRDTPKEETEKIVKHFKTLWKKHARGKTP